MYNDVISLLKVENGTDASGNRTEIITKNRDVFAKVKSIGYKEKYEAMAVGLKPELTFVLADYYDYDGEEDVLFDNKRYSVIRTYQKLETNEIELVVSRNAGTE